MENLSTLRCPGCNAPSLLDVGDGSIRCEYCNSSFVHPDRLCPQCGAVNELDDLDCPQCGQALRGLCPICNTPNPLQGKVCRRCGSSLDLLGGVMDRHFKTSSDLIYSRGAEATAIKQQEEQASSERMARMWEHDHARAQRLVASRAKQQQQEQTLVKVAVILGIIVLAAVIISVVILLTRGG